MARSERGVELRAGRFFSDLLEEERDGGAAQRDKRATDDQAHGAKNAHPP
jgi:hypothetical protein